MSPTLVVKVGGSLFNLPDLETRLGAWLRLQRDRRVLLTPGGGPAADVIRHYDQMHRLGDEAAHWLALRMVQVNAQVLAYLLPGAVVENDPRRWAPLAILDGFAFAQADESDPGHLPHIWDATSDSLAVRAAHVAGAQELVLLKSATWPGQDWDEAARAGVVDAHFPTALRQVPELRVRVVNLRTWQPPS